MSHHRSSQRNHRNDQERSYHEQQVLLFWLLSKILRRLARSIAWSDLNSQERRRLGRTLTMLESDVHLVRLVTALPAPPERDSSQTSRKL